MKILFDLTGLYDHITGVERYAMELADAFLKDFPEHNYVLVFKHRIHERFNYICGMENVETVILKKGGRFMTGQVRLPICLYKQEVDAYLFLAFPEPLLFFRKNIITAVHDMTPWEKGETMKPLSRLYYMLSHLHAMCFAKYIVTISKFSLGRIKKLLHVPKRKLKLVRCGVSAFRVNEDIDIYKKYELPEKYCMTLSTIEPRKKLSLLLDAYEKLIADGQDVPNLVIAGRKGWLVDKLVNKYSEKLKDKVCFTGFVDEEDMGLIYKNASFFVFPSEYEGFGMPPLEAMSMGCMVLSSDASSMPEVLGKAAVYFKSGDKDDLAEKLLFMSGISEEKKIKCRPICKKRSEMFDWHREAARLENVVNR